MRLTIPAAVSAAFLALSANAQDLKLSGQITLQSQFRALSEDLGAALSYKPQIPTEPLGITGFDIGVAVSSTELANSKSYAAALDGKSNLILPTLRAHKGLPFGIDVGVAYASVPDSNISYLGGELRYAIISGGVLAPAVGVRGSFSQVRGVDELAFDTKGLDLSVSKGFAFATPYAGVGKVWVSSDPKIGIPLQTESFGLTKYYAGLGINMLLMNLNLEADKTGDATSYSAKLGIRF